MNDLIKIEQSVIAGTDVQTVDARELHAFLQVGRDFTNWIKERVEKYGFQEGRDYSPVLANRSDGLPGKPRTEYILTLDMAKELAMVENNEQGRQARQYFIECERRARQPLFLIPQTLPEALRLAADLADQNKKLEGQMAEQAPKIEAFTRISDAEGSLCMRDAAKVLQVRPIDLRNWLIVNRWIYGRPGHSGWLAYQDKIQQGMMCHKVNTVHREDGTDKVVEQPRVTPKGMAKIAEGLQQKAA